MEHDFMGLVAKIATGGFLHPNASALKIKLSYKISCSLILFNKINITTYFVNLIIELHVLYPLNKHVKFCINQILFTI